MMIPMPPALLNLKSTFQTSSSDAESSRARVASFSASTSPFSSSDMAMTGSGRVGITKCGGAGAGTGGLGGGTGRGGTVGTLGTMRVR